MSVGHFRRLALEVLFFLTFLVGPNRKLVVSLILRGTTPSFSRFANPDESAEGYSPGRVYFHGWSRPDRPAVFRGAAKEGPPQQPTLCTGECAKLLFNTQNNQYI